MGDNIFELEKLTIGEGSIARVQFYRQLKMQKLRYECALGKADPVLQKLYDEVSKLREEYADKVDDEKCPILFLTINPDPKKVSEYMPAKDLKKYLDDIVKKKWVKRWLYVLEQRGSDLTELGLKPHAHLLIFRDGKRPSHCIREIASKVAGITKVEDDRIFNCQFVKGDDDNVKKVLNYVLGLKQGKHREEKQVKQGIDKIWREQNNIEPYYQKSFLEFFSQYKVEQEEDA